jgi:hypothetical protein
MLAAVAPVQAAYQAAKISIERNVQVSVARANIDHGEVVLCADSNDPRHLVVGAFDNPQESWKRFDVTTMRNVVAYTSINGGRTWESSLDVREYAAFSADPSCAFGTNGAVYFAAMRMPKFYNGDADVIVFSSRNAGQTWSHPVVLGHATTGSIPGAGSLDNFLDREYVTVDARGRRDEDRVYVSSLTSFARSGSVGFVLFRSDNGGQTFSVPVGFKTQGGFYHGSNVVLRDGTFVGSYYERHHDNTPNKTGSVKVVTAGTNSKTFSSPTVVSEGLFSPTDPGLLGSDVADPIPTLAVDTHTTLFRDRLYLAWADARSGRWQIWFSFSTDKGKSWTRARPVWDDALLDTNHPARGPHQGTPVITVNKYGVVGILWYEWRSKKESGFWPMFTASLDGGETFTQSVRVSEAPYQPSNGATFGFIDYGETYPLILAFGPHYGGPWSKPGDTAGLAADADGAFHGAWIDNRTGTNQVWTARIKVNGSPIKLVDVTRQVAVQISGYSFNARMGSAAVTVRLQNVSNRPIFAPLKLEVMLPHLTAPNAFLAADADNACPGIGAAWDFSPLLSRGVLFPHATTEPRELHFRVTSTRYAFAHAGENYPKSSLLVLRVLGARDR